MEDWNEISDPKEKYQAYLCSREWAEKREAVRNRSGGVCERCELLPMSAVHHLTYQRKYDENLDDLQAICEPCHLFTHGKSDVDLAIRGGWIGYLRRCYESGVRPCPADIIFAGEDTANELIRVCFFYIDLLRKTTLPFETCGRDECEAQQAILQLMPFYIPPERQRIQWEVQTTPGKYVQVCEMLGLEARLRDEERWQEPNYEDA